MTFSHNKSGGAGIKLILTFIALSGVAAASQFGVSAIGSPQINLTTNRLVILDDPSGWDGGAAGITDRGDQWSGESTTIRWYVLLMNSPGVGAGNITVTSQILFPNGTVAVTKANTTSSFGIAAFDQDMDRWLRFNGSGSEGTYTIKASTEVDNTPVAGSYNFIYDEWGCGSSGSNCHKSQYWPGGFIDSQVASTFAAGSVQNSPYLHAWDNFHSITSHGFGGGFIGNGECLTCHRGYDGVTRNHSSREQATPQYPAGIHSGKVACTGCHSTFNSGPMPILQCYDCHPIRNNNLTVKTFSQTNTSGFSYNPLTDSNITAHNAGQNIPCIMCHNGMHNVSKPYNVTETSNSFTEYQQCTSCHSARTRHNDSVSCTVCHSQDAHAIKVFAQNATYIQGAGNAYRGNCTSCHQNSSFLDELLLQPKAGSHTGSAPQVPNPLNHSNDPIAGMKWNATPGYWLNGTGAQPSPCKYCHGDTLHKTAALGRPSLWKGNNIVNSTFDGTSWCASCHYQGYASGANAYNDMVNTFLGDNLLVPPEITGNPTFGANSSAPAYFNHSSIDKDDSSCKSCHGSLASGASITGFMHNVATGSSGGANCIGCHDIGGTAGKGRLVNFSAMNDSGDIHKNLNINATSPSGYSSENFKCWACHGNGSEPGNRHPSNYRTPYRCPDCHIPAAGQNLNFTPSSIPNVNQHYWNGTSIKTAAVSSCYDCHNKSEMMLGSIDPDGAASVYGGANGGNNSTSHYGKKRTDLRIGTIENCYYCHQNLTTAFSNVMQRPDISTFIYNHTTAAFPDCGSCHGTGWIHNSTLSVPTLNNDFCSGCHSFGIGSKRPIPATHNSTMNCWNCHQDPNGTMYQAPAHGMMYAQENGSYLRFNKGTPANCTTCHVFGLVNTSASIAPRIPPLNHSTDPSSGRKWGNYWDNTSMISACYYCHQSEIHKASVDLPGNVTIVKGSNTFNNPDLANSTWCENCHYAKALEYRGNNLTPPPPEITNSSLVSSNGTSFFNHSGFDTYNDSQCKNCHGSALSGYAETTLNFSHSVGTGGGGPNCISCHDIGGSGAPANKRINELAMKQGVHNNLNSNATNSTAIDPINKACWACHGEGNEPAGHPARYKTPRECSNNDCHSLSQSFKAPMVYSHFQDAALNSNPTNVTNFNISTSVPCEVCHSNSESAQGDNLNASVSHYATTENLIDSMNCVYCHLDKDNSEKWGNATEINKNSTTMIELDKINNKFTAREGEFVDLGLGYRIKVTGISTMRGSAAIELYKTDTLVDKGLVNIGSYTYEEYREINNGTSKVPVIILNITGMFVSNNGSFIQFEGTRVRRVHSENRTTSCYLCHYNWNDERHKYTVIDRRDDNIFYSEVFFNSSDRNEFNQEQALQILANSTTSDVHVSIDRNKRMTLVMGEKWEIGANYSLTLEDVADRSDSARLLLEVDGTNYENIVKRGDVFVYEPEIVMENEHKNTTIFQAKVSEIIQGTPGIVVLEDILALSPEINEIKDNTTISGYNTSWLWENNTFLTGKIPINMHVPLLQQGKDGGPDCRSCHNVGQLGAHTVVNSEAASDVDAADKACWACHGDGTEPKRHPADYKDPRVCKSCHVEQRVPFYNATYIGDEKHGTLENCRDCHVTNTHNILRFDVVPTIKALSISKKEVTTGESITINATAVAGYDMKIRAGEYYIDSPANMFPMAAQDGSFDEQTEGLTATFDTSGLSPGNHTIYVRAMERNNKWGPETNISFELKGKEVITKDGNTKLDVFVLLPLFILLILIFVIFRKAG